MHPRRPPRLTGARPRPRHAAARPPRSLPVRLAGRVVIGVFIPMLGVTWLLGNHQVTLQVDGRSQQLTTHARTVDELLDRAGVAYSEADDVTPTPDTPVRDGMVVEVVRAREVTLLMDGEEETVLVTALSVEDVINQIARRRGITQQSVVRPSRLTAVTSGMTVEVLNPVAVTVVADGEERDVVTDAATVQGVLHRLGITLDGNDRVSAGAAAPVEAGLRIIVQRVRVGRERREVAVAFGTEKRGTGDLPRGEQREVRPGIDGVEEITEKVTFVDGAEASRDVVSREVLTQPQTRIVEVGTGSRPTEESAPASETQPPRPAPRSDPPSPPEPEPEPEPAPAKTSSSRTQSGQASYYYHPSEGMTAAHRTLPMGTVVTVTNQANGKSIQVTINDRGPYVDGRIIDLNEQAFRQIAAKSSGVINVRITW